MEENLHQSLRVNVGGQEQKIEFSILSCPVCFSEQSHLSNQIVHEFGEVSIVKCANCNTMHLKPMPCEDSLKAIYNNNYYNDEQQEHGYFDYEAEAGAIEKTYIKRLKFIQNTIQHTITPTTKFHEIGCALGIGLSTINHFFCTSASGSDISEDAEKATIAKKIPFYRSNSKGQHNISGNLKDVVCIFDVVEHLSDIPTFVSFLDQLVNESGYVVITTPNMDSWLNKLLGAKSPSIKIPQHTIYFTTETLCKALQKNFTLIKSKSDYQYAPISRIVERIFHILGMKIGSFKGINIDLLVPNGMSVYIFKKRV